MIDEKLHRKYEIRIDDRQVRLIVHHSVDRVPKRTTFVVGPYGRLRPINYAQPRLQNWDVSRLWIEKARKIAYKFYEEDKIGAKYLGSMKINIKDKQQLSLF